MSKIGIDLRQIKERGSKGRKKPKQDPGEVLEELASEGWQAVQTPPAQKGWEKRLGSISRCPICDHHKCRRCRKRRYEDTPNEWSRVRHQENAAHFSLTRAAGWDGRDTYHYLQRCCRCKTYTAASLWLFRTKQPEGYHSTQIDMDDAGAQVPATQKRLLERAALQDAVSEEVNRMDRPNEKEQAYGQD